MAKKITRFQQTSNKLEETIKKANKIAEEFIKHSYDLHRMIIEIQMLFEKIRNVSIGTKQRIDNLKGNFSNWNINIDTINSEIQDVNVKIANEFNSYFNMKNITLLIGSSDYYLLNSIANVLFSFKGIKVSKSFSVHSIFEQKRIHNICRLIYESKINHYNLGIVETSERLLRVIDECIILDKAARRIKTFGVDYSLMTENQQYELGSYVNLMESSISLMTTPIEGFLPRYREIDYDKFCKINDFMIDGVDLRELKNMFLLLCDMLYEIELSPKDKKVFCSALESNKDIMNQINMSKKEFAPKHLLFVELAIKHKKSLEMEE